MDACQSKEQVGFRSGRSTADALLILQKMAHKSIEWNVLVWVVSVHLRKTVDRTEHRFLFQALRRQGGQPQYLKGINQVYDHHIGIMGDDVRFPIHRGLSKVTQ